MTVLAGTARTVIPAGSPVIECLTGVLKFSPVI